MSDQPLLDTEVHGSTTVRVKGWPGRWADLVNKLTIVDTEDDVQRLLDRIRSSTQPLTLAFVNAHAMNMAAKSATFYQSLMDADVLLRDGIGMSILLSMMGTDSGLNMNGTDLIPDLLNRYVHADVAMFGTKDVYLQQAVEALRTEGHQGSMTLLDGFQATERYLSVASQSKPAILVLGMGMPKQEAVAAQLRQSLAHACVIVCGGAIIDFLGGKVSRAPQFVRALHMEWFYRLCLEPRRLFQRYVIGNPIFLARALSMSLTSRHGNGG